MMDEIEAMGGGAPTPPPPPPPPAGGWDAVNIQPPPPPLPQASFHHTVSPLTRCARPGEADEDEPEGEPKRARVNKMVPSLCGVSQDEPDSEEFPEFDDAGLSISPDAVAMHNTTIAEDTPMWPWHT